MENYTKMEDKTAESTDLVNSQTCPDFLDRDSVELELKKMGVSEDHCDSVDTVEMYSLTCLTVQRYEGETCAGQFNGEGVAYFEGGHMYKGMFSKGLMDGCGVFTHAEGLKYEGAFVCGLPMGRGVYTWADGSSYEGEVSSSLRHGTGTHTCFRTRVVYTGQWRFGKRHGKGAIYYNQEKTSWYKGDWVRNRKEGWGVRCYPSGNLYSGEWRNNLRHGEGTMRWMNLQQQYVGMWQNGVQHGRGTHYWNMNQGEGLHFFLSSQYTGEFVGGQRHGQGRICFASGATYDGEWENNNSQSKGKFTSADGLVFEGDHVYDQMMARCLKSSRALTPLSDMTLNIEHLLVMIPAGHRDTEYEQAVFAVLKLGAELRSIYRFYSRLGRSRSPYGLIQMTRLQLWRLLKDCNIHHHLTLTQADQFIRGEDEAIATDVHSPFTPVFLRQFVSVLVVVGYHIYHPHVASETSLLGDCFTKLMTDNIVPNATCVKGFVFRQPDYTVVAVNHLQKCWEIYKNYCKSSAATRSDQTMTCRDLLWMFKGLNLLDDNLTTARLMEIITAERLHPTNLTSCLDEEITFLEFFEVLFGCAEAFLQVSEDPDVLPLSSPDTEAKRDLPEAEIEENTMHTTSTQSQQAEMSSDITESPPGQDQKSQEDLKPVTKVTGESQTAEPTEEHGHDKHGTESDDKVTGCEVQRKIRTVQEFFSQLLFPAYEHPQT